MALSIVSVVFLLSALFGGRVCSQDLKYETHPPYVQPGVRTLTLTDTVTRTHTVRQVVTSGVVDEDMVTHTVVVTSLRTSYDFTPLNDDTVTSVVTATATPVQVVTRTVVAHPVRTFTSVFSTFTTTTETADFVYSVTSEATQQSVLVVPVYETRVLQQTVVTTNTLVLTLTTTLSKYGYA